MCLVLYYPRRCGGLNPVTMWKMYERSGERKAQLGKYAAILVASAHMRREYERHGVKPERIHLAALPNPNEGAEFHTAPRTGSRSNLLFLGRVTKLKGAAELLGAIPIAEKQLGRPLAVTIAGDGPERQRLEELARRNRLKAEFTGWVGSSRKADLMEQADLMVVPSLWPEPFGLVGIEAGAHGLPAVAYDVGGISDWLISAYSGELAPGHPPTVEGLADAITRALSDPSHYSGLCRGAREVAGRFTLAAHVSKLESTLESILETARRTPAVLLR
jgi:glycosyltransferase involved in cell wall biosynthesis